ncbi:MAG TPA: calcium-binding protein [Coleofasciculaceae cyanobacterium]
MFSVPLSDIKSVEADDETQQAIADWHYWVDIGYELVEE